MIDKILNLLVSELGQFLKINYGMTEEPVVCGNLVDLDGSVAVGGDNKLVLTLVNIEHETAVPRSMRETDHGKNGILSSPSPLYFNIVILLSAYFQKNNYPEALKYLSAGISFFQRRPVVAAENTAAICGLTDRITIENMNLSLNELGNLWGQLGGKYLPSILYKVRMVPFDGNYPVAASARIVGAKTGAVPR